MAVVGHDEAVQIEVKTVLKGGAVDLRHQPAHAGESRSVESDALADRDQFDGRLARMLAAAAADMNAELAASGSSPRFSAPITLVVMPEECQSMPMTAPNDWNQNG